MNIDLDPIIAAKAEQTGEAPSVSLQGETFSLPPTLDILRMAELAEDGNNFAALFRELLGRKQYARFRVIAKELSLNADQLRDVLEQIGTLYQASVPESSASGD